LPVLIRSCGGLICACENASVSVRAAVLQLLFPSVNKLLRWVGEVSAIPYSLTDGVILCYIYSGLLSQTVQPTTGDHGVYSAFFKSQFSSQWWRLSTWAHVLWHGSACKILPPYVVPFWSLLQTQLSVI